jgi:anaerobic magnesium-protoporphyrin IX monomethyl ester cyclase
MLRDSGHAVSLHDLNVKNSFASENLAQYNSAVITTAPIDRWETPYLDYQPALNIVEQCKVRGLQTILIGPHGTVTPNLLFEQCRYIDIIVRGEPEATIREVFSSKPLETVQGISYRDKYGIHHNSDRGYLDNLDELPFPAYDLLNMNEYRYNNDRLPPPFSIVESSRGCPMGCVFCLKVMHGRMYRTRSPKLVVDELELLVKDYGIRSVYFQDLEFTLDEQRVKEICKEINERRLGLRWGAAARVTDVKRELLGAMKGAGCVLLAFGVESLSPKILQVAKKGTTIKAVIKAYRLCEEMGIQFKGFWIAGLPGESTRTLEESMQLAIEYNIPHPMGKGLVIPYPGTELYKMAKEQGLVKEGTWEEVAELRGKVGVDEPIARTYTLKSLHQYFQYNFGEQYWLKPEFLRYILARIFRKVRKRRD